MEFPSVLNVSNVFITDSIIFFYLPSVVVLFCKLLINIFIILITSLRITSNIMKSHFCMELNMPKKLK